jgi:hypothetical protein
MTDAQIMAHPSVGGTRGYDIHTRKMMVEMYESGDPFPWTMICSIQRWARRIVPHRMTGNKLGGLPVSTYFYACSFQACLASLNVL